jgi:hypothetical protein
MSVTSVALYRNGTSGGRTNDGKVKYSATYLVETDTVLDQTAVICDYFKNAGNLPYLNKPYSYANDSDPSAICNSISPQRQPNSHTTWIVTFEYATPESQKKDEDQPRQEPDNNGNLTPDPTRWRERWDMGFTQISIPVEGAIYISGISGMPAGKFIMPCNSAGEPFLPPLEKEQDIAVLRRSFYVDLWDHSFVDFFQGTINDNAVNVVGNGFSMLWTAAPFTLRCKSIGGSLEWINNFGWWRIDIEWWKKTDTWDVFAADRGLNRRAEVGAPTGRGSNYEQTDIVVDGTGASTRAFLIPILDADGNPIRTPVFLDSTGRPLVSVTQPINYIRYRIYNAVSYPDSMFMR